MSKKWSFQFGLPKVVFISEFTTYGILHIPLKTIFSEQMDIFETFDDYFLQKKITCIDQKCLSLSQRRANSILQQYFPVRWEVTTG